MIAQVGCMCHDFEGLCSELFEAASEDDEDEAKFLSEIPLPVTN